MRATQSIMGVKKTDLFSQSASIGRPLADRLRPRTLEDIVGQKEVLGPGKPLQRLLATGHMMSLILWGPPGSGKTTLAYCIANHWKADFIRLSAVMAGVKDLRIAIEQAEENLKLYKKPTLLFIDEIHRFNKVQQDALLPHVESGLFTFIGATTENPSFELTSSLLSRCRIIILKPLQPEDIVVVLKHALADPALEKIQADSEALQAIAALSHGDARHALNTLEIAAEMARERESPINAELVEQAAQRKLLLYDKSGEEHYNVISAFIKSMRGSDANGALYWLVRMLEAGEDPNFILRRMVIFASEDIGNADPQALIIATAAIRAFNFVGLPEGVLPLTQAVGYLARAPKSNKVLTAYGAARKDVLNLGALPVPAKLRNAVTKFMKKIGYGKDYKYPHDFEGNYVEETYLPDELVGRKYF
jgi:putative ATPase